MFRQKTDDYARSNPYYETAKLFRLYKYLTIVVFVAFVLGGLSVVGGDELSEDIRYLFKYMNSSAPELTDGDASVSFEGEGTTVTGIFRGDFAVLKKGTYKLYGFNGELIFSDTVSMTNPAMKTSGRYVLCYDIGGKTLKIYNSFSLIHTETYSYPIISADISDNGTYCVVTSEKGYHAAIYVYDSEFRILYRWLTAEKFAIDAAICESDDSRILVSCARASGGDFSGELIELSTKNDTVKSSTAIEGELPLQISFSGDGSYRVLTSSHFRVYDNNAGTVNEYDLTSNTIDIYRTKGKYTCIAVGKSSIGQERTALIYDAAGTLLYEFDIKSQLYDIAIDSDGGKIYILASEHLYTVYPEAKRFDDMTVSQSFRKLLLPGGSRLALQGESSVKLIMIQ